MIPSEVGSVTNTSRNTSPLKSKEVLDVIIVGAGAAGIGCGIILKNLGFEQFALLERYDVGASFARWPEEMRFITPSFPSNAFGLLDLNAVALQTSPAYSLGKEHISGHEFALYLQGLVKHFELPVCMGVNVETVQQDGDGNRFVLTTSHGIIRSRFVIWAAGEFQYPRLDSLLGASSCLHTTQVRSWRDLEGDAFVVIGGYESGIDAAVNLVALCKHVCVLDSSSAWNVDDEDPSVTLSPYTKERLLLAQQSGQLELVGATHVTCVEHDASGYLVHTEQGIDYKVATPPILAAGFTGSLHCIADLFEWNEDGHVLLTDEDESTRTPGLFVVGPGIRHDQAIFCFIYKFRQRFAVVANALAQRLGVDTELLDYYRQNGMFLDDLSCCGDECAC
jgi:putative flavoprotein involved in K+ transport